jgi:tRNA dimethylallyltransferase
LPDTKIALIAGPTASGKSAFALNLARETGGEIVNADSMQIYAGLRVLTAGPSPDELAQAPHHLFGVADAADGWSVGRWLTAATAGPGRDRRARPPRHRGRRHGPLFPRPDPRPGRRAAGARDPARDLGPALRRPGRAGVPRRVLAALDPEAEARIEIGDRQRLVRAHAVAVATGKSLTAWQTDTKPALAPGSWRGVVLDPPRAELYDRCDARLGLMVQHGALDEVRAMEARGLDPSLPALKAVGYRELAAHLRGETSLDEALDAARQETRRYAKRQMTWFRNQTPDWEGVPSPKSASRRKSGPKPSWIGRVPREALRTAWGPDFRRDERSICLADTQDARP